MRSEYGKSFKKHEEHVTYTPFCCGERRAVGFLMSPISPVNFAPSSKEFFNPEELSTKKALNWSTAAGEADAVRFYANDFRKL